MRNIAHVINIGGLVGLSVVIFVFAGAGCFDDAPINYEETIVLQGHIGDSIGDLGYIRLGSGEAIFTSTFAVGADGSIWISDPAHGVIKRFTTNGKVIGIVKCNDMVVDDIAVTDSNRLLVSSWNRAYIDVIDTGGQSIVTCPLPSVPASMTSVFTSNDAMYASFYEYKGKEYHVVGLQFSPEGELLTRREDSLQMWVESCGRYYSRNYNYDNWLSENEILDGAGNIFVKHPDTGVTNLSALGVDSDFSLYVVRTVTAVSPKPTYQVIRYSPNGDKTATFNIRDFETKMAHYAKLDISGNVYVFACAENATDWYVYKYSPRK